MSFLNESPLERILRQAREREEQKKKAIGSLLAGGFNLKPQYAPPFLRPLVPTKRKVFISYHHGDDVEVRNFVRQWTIVNKVFIPMGLGIKFTDDIIDSTDTSYVMSQIRKKYLQDSSVTVVLIGSCTHSRRYVDWEIKASLRQATLLSSPPNGLIGIILPYKGRSAHLPPRFEDNWTSGHVNCYARYYVAPTSANQLRGWIEDAYKARTERAKYIKNTSDIMKNNATCKECGITHPA